ncbi:hypothetical protein LTR53_009731 [Teratosphaeriaceae sp. CCFEE 6253]|nr:hypothetical protein LTR53_009731 [Teratosphaeriaceae sp. CCFEE 6253]
MEPPPVFRLSPLKAHPLATLSPERVNRNISTASTATTASKASRTAESEAEWPSTSREPSSTHSSPTRRANLFADYNPATPKQTMAGFGGLPQSPSLPEISALRGHVRTNSDVHGLVKRFEHLDVRDRDAESADRRRKHDAELRRAQIAREEAESDVKRLREELRYLKREGEEERERERKVGRRLEVVMEEYVSAKEQHSSQHAVYEKELRRARKEAYKSSSAVIKLQEELKATRNSLRGCHSKLDEERQRVQRREQDAFSAQYRLAAVQEEMDKLGANLKIVEEEREALKMTLREDELSRIAAKGMIALPMSKDDDDLCALPGKRSPLSDDKENVGVVPKRILESKRLEEELLQELMRREHAEQMVEFLGLECRFRCCRCRSSHADVRSKTSGELAETLDSVVASMKAASSPEQEAGADAMDMETSDEQSEHLLLAPGDPDLGSGVENQPHPSPAKPEADEPAADDRVDHEVDRSMTMTADEGFSLAPHPSTAPAEAERATVDSVGSNANEPDEPDEPSTPPLISRPSNSSHHPPLLRTITTTTTVPMHFTPISKPMHFTLEDAENIPPATHDNAIAESEPTFDRAAALAAIEYRRGRAKSFQAGHLTPRKQMLEGVGAQRRDISAPALGGKVGGVRGYAKGAGSVGRAGRRMV